MVDPSTLSDDFTRSFAAALGLSYEELTADFDASGYSATRVTMQLEAETQRMKEQLRQAEASANARMTRLLVVITSDNPDRLTDLMLSSDRRQRKRGDRLYRQALNAQHNARWATLEGITYDA